MDALAPLAWGLGGIAAALVLHVLIEWRSRRKMKAEEEKDAEELEQLQRELEYLRVRETQKADPVAMGLTDRDGVDRLHGLRHPVK